MKTLESCVKSVQSLQLKTQKDVGELQAVYTL